MFHFLPDFQGEASLASNGGFSCYPTGASRLQVMKGRFLMVLRATTDNRIELKAGDFGWDFVIEHDDGRSIYVQSDWEYPAFAVTFGWTPCKRCRETGANETDGTINCHHRYASAMVRDAGRFLTKRIGKRVEDPGYFE